jgi:hypothetical protein
MAGYRNLQHGAKALLRKGRLALLWGVQVAVFPAYVAFQGMRTGYRRLQSKHPWQALKGLLTGSPVQEIPVTADTPIRALLSAIQPQVAPKGGWLRSVNYHGAFLRQSHAGGVLTNGGWHLVPVKEPIRGIASDLATRKLVLITVGNIVFEGLTEDQQGRLECAIALLLAEYAFQVKQHQLGCQRQQPGLPLPKAEPNQWFVVRWLHQGMRWMQTGSLAAVTNLFGEAQQRHLKYSRRLVPSQATNQPSGLSAEAPAWMQPKAFLPSDVMVAASFHAGGPANSLTEQTPEAELELKQNQYFEGQSIQTQRNDLSISSAEDRTELYWPTEIETIEARVSNAAYIDHWFVQLLRWIDTVLLWLEQTARRLWQTIRQWPE